MTTPFASVIGTNYIPSKDEIGELRTFLVEPQIRLSQLESEIARLQDLLESVFLERDSVKEYVDAHRALMSPIRRLPPETLSEIFTHCLPDRYAVRDTSEAPVLLTKVSRHWRHTAISTPALWTLLLISLPGNINLQGFEKRTIGSSLWLKRSGSLPLSISFSMDTSLLEQSQTITDTDPTMERIDRLIADILLENSSRIEELSFAGSKIPHMATHLNHLASRCFPILKVFRVCLNTRFVRYNPTETLPFASIVQQMPALNSFAIVGFPASDGRFAKLNLGWENLTELRLLNDDVVFASDETLSILVCASRLQFFTISVDIFTWSTETTVLNLPSMHEMRLTFHYPWQQDISQARTCLQKLYHSMVCPSLKTLYTSWDGNGSVRMDMPFSAFSLLKELGTLETLSLDMPFTSSTLIDSLSLNPELRFLEISNQGYERFEINEDLSQGFSPLLLHTVDDSVLSALSLITEEGDHVLCPDLQHIQIISEIFTPSITNSVLLTFLETRVFQTKTLRSCYISLTYPRAECTEDEKRRFQMLFDSGLLKLRIWESGLKWRVPG